VARRAAAKFGIDVNYAQLDYVEDGPEKYIHATADLAFTMFSLEQILVRNAQALTNIIGAVGVGSLHLEPVPENYPMTLRGILGRMEHRRSTIYAISTVRRGPSRCANAQWSRLRLRTIH
jgi:hypothetical protein